MLHAVDMSDYMSEVLKYCNSGVHSRVMFPEESEFMRAEDRMVSWLKAISNEEVMWIIGQKKTQSRSTNILGGRLWGGGVRIVLFK